MELTSQALLIFNLICSNRYDFEVRLDVRKLEIETELKLYEDLKRYRPLIGKRLTI